MDHHHPWTRRSMWALFVRVVMASGVAAGGEDSFTMCPFDPGAALKALNDPGHPLHVKHRRVAVFPRYNKTFRKKFKMIYRHVIYTGPFDPDLRKLTINQGEWPEFYEFHFYNDSRMDASMRAAAAELEIRAGLRGVYQAYTDLRAMAFRADLWRYAMLWACGGFYVDSKMALAMNIESFMDKAAYELLPEHPNATQKRDVIVTCVDRWGTKLDRFQNMTALWQGLLVSTPRHPDWLKVLRYAVANIRARLYPDWEGKLKMLYITGPCAMGRAIQTNNPDWKRTVKLPCHWGSHGPRLRTVWGSGADLFIMNDKLHEKLRGGVSHSYPNLYYTKQIYKDDPPCVEYCKEIGIQKGQVPEDALPVASPTHHRRRLRSSRWTRRTTTTTTTSSFF